MNLAEPNQRLGNKIRDFIFEHPQPKVKLSWIQVKVQKIDAHFNSSNFTSEMKGGNSSLCLMSHTKWRIIPIRLNCITESMATVEFFPGACTSAHHKVGLTPLSRFKVLSVNKLLINTMDLYMVLGTGIQNKEKHGFIA